MKKLIAIIGLLTIGFTTQLAQAKILNCSYTSKINSLTSDNVISDKLVIDTNITGTKNDEALVTSSNPQSTILQKT